MQRTKHPPNPNQRNELMVNDMVFISERFFINHAIHDIFHQVGTGVVTEISPPTKDALPKAVVKFPFHSCFVNVNTLKALLVTDTRREQFKGSHIVLIEIHPMYLEKIIVKERKKHHGKENHQDVSFT